MQLVWIALDSVRRALFTPLCVSVDGMLGKEATKFVQHLADELSYN